MSSHQRQAERVTVAQQLSVQLNLAPQLTIHGELKDISYSGAFVKVANRIYFEPQAELRFSINPMGQPHNKIQGIGRIARISAKEGIGISFTNFDWDAPERLKQLIVMHLWKH